MIVTRFAPSPTGFLHIGGARTALFNWLYAKHTGGEFLLRIEDTDKQRSTKEAIEAIINGLKWLGLDWDKEIVLQSTRAQRHKEVAMEMVEKGGAYYCYATLEEIKEFREQNPYQPFISPWRDGKGKREGVKPAIRLRADRDGALTIQDKVQGEVRVDNAQLDDMILLRSDGTPTYMLAVVVDDYDMGVTTVIRGDDHFTNTFRQNQIYKAMNWQAPQDYCHIPLIHGPDGKKLSKRHGAMGVEEYRDMGYLPEAITSYLLRLGWSHNDDDIISLTEAIALFDFDGLGKSPSRFDFAKLGNINAHYIKHSSPNKLLNELQSRMYILNLDDEIWKRIEKGLPLLQERAVTINDLMVAAEIFIKKNISITDAASKAIETAGTLEGIVFKSLYSALDELKEWSHDGISMVCKDLVARLDTKMGVVMQLLRATIVGALEGPGIIDVMVILGDKETLRRMGG